jgi:hypothetical protein
MPTPKLCTTLATHLWSQGTSLHLSLPGTDGWYDILRSWQCQRCGLQTWATGAIERTTPPLTPLEWEARATWQQGSGDVYGQEVKRQEQWKQQHAGLSRRLQAGARR